MRFQFASNIFINHLSSCSTGFSRIVQPGRAEILCLLGDIGCPTSDITRQFINFCSKNWDKVLWVPGLLELSQKKFEHGNWTMEESLDEINKICNNNKNVINMNNNYYKNGEYLFLGSPLWGIDYSRFNRIPNLQRRPSYDSEKINSFQLASMNSKNISWFDSHIEEALEMNEKVICLSYSTPIMKIVTGRDKKRCNIMRNYSEGLLRHPVKMWLVGDFYESIYGMYNNIPILSNSFYYNIQSLHNDLSHPKKYINNLVFNAK